MGDFGSVLAFDHQLLGMPDRGTWENTRVNDVATCASMHDADCADELRRQLPVLKDQNILLNRRLVLQLTDIFLERWRAALAPSAGILETLSGLGRPGQEFISKVENPYLALVEAQLADFKSARSLIDASPLDCAVCLRIRGRIDEEEKNWAGAEYWFRRAASYAPSMPFADTDWGHMLLVKGDADGAIVKLTRAHLVGPKFADPIEYWGEALMMKNRSDLALAKFADANSDAPHWGRLHLKWGEALYYVGRRADAKEQFAQASRDELSTNEKTELTQADKLN